MMIETRVLDQVHVPRPHREVVRLLLMLGLYMQLLKIKQNGFHKTNVQNEDSCEFQATIKIFFVNYLNFTICT